MNLLLARLATIGALCVGVLSPCPVFAQAIDPQRAATAQTIYEQATVDMDEKDYVAACKKLEEVVTLVPDALGAKMTLGECYEARGKTASAWSQYAIVDGLASKQGQTERARKAAEKAATLKPKLAMLTVEVPPEVGKTPGLAITRDGVPVGDVQWGTPLPIDAGEHEIVVSATGRKVWKKHIEILADGAKITVKVSAAGLLPKTVPVVTRPWQLPVGIVTIGLGAAGVSAGAVLGGLAISKNDDSKRDGQCDAQDTCDAAGFKVRNEARALGNGSTIALMAGGIGLAGGVVLLATAPKRAGQNQSSAKIELSPYGLSIRGTW